MERAGEILGAAMRRVKDPEAARAWLTSAWTTLVGESVAAHTLPVAFREGTLRIEADSAEWQRQLEAMTAEVRAQINRAWGSGLVRQVRIEPAARHVSPAEDNAHTPFIRRRTEHREP